MLLTVPHGLGLEDVTLERVVPGDGVVAGSEVLLVEDLKADALEGLARVVQRAHLGDAITDLDTVRNLLVLGLGLVPLVGHAPLVHAELVSAPHPAEYSQCLRA